MKTLLRVWSLAIILAFGMGEALGQYVWIRDAYNPVLDGGMSMYVSWPCVLFNSDSSRYEMWFNAYSGSQDPSRIGFAYSKDGVNWTMHPSFVLSPDAGTWDAFTVLDPMVIRQNGQYKMWYSSFLSTTAPGYIGYATSSDGIHWTEYSGNPVLGPGAAGWESLGLTGCAVIPVSGGFKMWYTAYEWVSPYTYARIGYATSADGIAWVKDPGNNPVLDLGASGQWDDQKVGVGISVLKLGSTFYMWYTGMQRASHSPLRVGLATSTDMGISWTKYAGNPVFQPYWGAWDGDWVGVGTVLLRGDTLHMWYSGQLYPATSNPLKIGHSTSLNTVVEVADREGAVPGAYMLLQNYPNPFNPSTTIKYDLPKPSEVRLSVYDMLGREVSVLVEEKKGAGRHEVKFDAAGLSSGVYIYRLRAEDFVSVKQLLLLR